MIPYNIIAMTDTHNHSPTDWEWANLIAKRHLYGALNRARNEPRSLHLAPGIPIWSRWQPPKLEGGK